MRFDDGVGARPIFLYFAINQAQSESNVQYITASVSWGSFSIGLHTQRKINSWGREREGRGRKQTTEREILFINGFNHRKRKRWRRGEGSRGGSELTAAAAGAPPGPLPASGKQIAAYTHNNNKRRPAGKGYIPMRVVIQRERWLKIYKDLRQPAKT